nr:indole-3-glycerol-phosphate synthase [Maliibacterium massiliense]
MKHPFSQALLDRARAGRVPVIADIKARSPKEGDLLRGRDPVQIARALKAAGAPCLSVVTEQTHFCGSLDMLRRVSEASGLPVLRKDFITSARDLAKTRDAGAAAILLICSMHAPARLETLYRAASDLGLEALVETHTAQELAFAQDLGAQLIGVNNRDILRLEQDAGDVGTTESLLGAANKKGLRVSESGIQTPKDVRRARAAGADAVLVGTALLKAADIAGCYRVLEEAL